MHFTPGVRQVEKVRSCVWLPAFVVHGGDLVVQYYLTNITGVMEFGL